MTVAGALEAGRRAYEAVAGPTNTGMPTAEPRCAPTTMQTRHDKRRAGILIGRGAAWDQPRANTQ